MISVFVSTSELMDLSTPLASLPKRRPACNSYVDYRCALRLPLPTICPALACLAASLPACLAACLLPGHTSVDGCVNSVTDFLHLPSLGLSLQAAPEPALLNPAWLDINDVRVADVNDKSDSDDKRPCRATAVRWSWGRALRKPCSHTRGRGSSTRWQRRSGECRAIMRL